VLKTFWKCFFSKENSAIGQKIYDSVLRLQPSTIGITFVNPQSLLQLFEFSFNNMSEESSQSIAEAELNIFKSILVLNEKNNRAQENGLAKTKDIEDEIKLPAVSLAISYPNSEFINYNITEILITQFIKASYLFEFLENCTKTQSLLNDFLSLFKCRNWKEYLKVSFSLALAVVKVENEGIIDIEVDKDDEFITTCEFIEQLSISKDSLLEEGFDFRAIRSNPIYQIKQGTYRVIYPLFVAELLFKGLYFKFKQINDSSESEKKVGSNFRSFYCDNFSEQTLLYKILSNFYSKRSYIQYSGVEIKEAGVTAEPDYYIRNGKHALLFESKDILINGSIKSTFNYQLYEEEFSKKLYFETKKGKRENKAVLQLLNNVERLLTKQLIIDTKYNVTTLNIYPILILHDRQFNVAGLNSLLNYWFLSELSGLSEKGINIKNVRSIVIVDIDTLILYEENFKNKDVTLENIIDKYFDYISTSNKRKVVTEDEANDYVTRRLIPFSLFLTNYIDSTINKKRKPKSLYNMGLHLFE